MARCKNVFLSYVGVWEKPVMDCFKFIDKEHDVDCVYLIYNDYRHISESGENLSSVECCKDVADTIRSYFHAGIGPAPVWPVSELHSRHEYEVDGKKIVTIPTYELQDDGSEFDYSFDLDHIIDLVLNISVECDNPKIHMNLTQGNQVFTGALCTAAYELGCSLYYVDRMKGARLIKDCTALDLTNLGKPEKNILYALSQIFSPESDIPDFVGSGQGRNRIGAYVKQRYISTYTENRWKKPIHPQAVSRTLPSLEKKGLVSTKPGDNVDGSESRKVIMVRITSRGRLAVSKFEPFSGYRDTVEEREQIRRARSDKWKGDKKARDMPDLSPDTPQDTV